MARIAPFIDQYTKTNTRRIYTTAIRAYLAFIYSQDRDRKIPMEVYEDLADRYLSDGRDYSQDVIGFAASFGNSPPKTARTYVAAVKEFLIFSEVELREMDLRKIKKKMPKGGAATVEKIMDVETIRTILYHCSLMMRALILLLVSSGMRIGEVLSLQLTDIDVDGEIGYITVRGTTRGGGGAKGGYQRYTFCSGEAAEIIREWKKKRGAYLVESLNRGRGIGQIKDLNDTRLFPVSTSTVNDAWLTALEAAGLVSRDSVTNRLQIHIHMTRKFFSSQLRLAVPDDVVEGLMGHGGYLSDAYRRYTIKQVEDLYRKGEPYITVQMSEEIRELRTTTEKKMAAHSEIIENLVRKDIERDRRLKELEDLTRTLQTYIQKETEFS